jgi:hypothetical protein
MTTLEPIVSAMLSHVCGGEDRQKGIPCNVLLEGLHDKIENSKAPGGDEAFQRTQFKDLLNQGLRDKCFADPADAAWQLSTLTEQRTREKLRW